MRLDGLNDHLVATGLEQAYYDSTAMTVGLLMKSPDVGVLPMSWVRTAAGSFDQVRWTILSSGGGNRPRYTIRDATTSVLDLFPSSGPNFADGEYHWWWVEDNNGSVSCYWDRETSAYLTGSYTRGTMGGAMDDAAVGCYYAGGIPASNCEMDLAQLIVVPRVLAQWERLYLHDTFNPRWLVNPRHVYPMGDGGYGVQDAQRSGAASVDLVPAGGLALSDILNINHAKAA